MWIVPFSFEIAMKAYTIPELFHKDPADRILVATALTEDLTFITADEQILDYPHVNSFNARK